MSMSRFPKTFQVVIVLAFCAFTIFAANTPKLFAQPVANTTNTDAPGNLTVMNSYADVIRNVLSTIEGTYVDKIDPKVLYQAALKGMLEALDDPYTMYMDISQTRDINDTTTGNFGGVGLQITKATKSTKEEPAYVEVAYPVEDGPGKRAGILRGDLLIKINGLPTDEMDMNKVLSLLRGPVGHSVSVTIRRGKSMEFDVTLIRDVIEVPTVKHTMIGDDIGYIKIIEFTPQTPTRVQDALDSFAKKNYSRLILDLRNNPGGLITSVVNVVDKFIDSGVIVSTKGRTRYNMMSYKARQERTTVPKDISIVVLINKGSASASEILAGALKDYHRAYLIGENSYGKGSVQQVMHLPYDDGMRITTARYYTPSDANIDKVGIPPDREVKLPDITENQEKTYEALYNSKVIQKYVEDHPKMSDDDVKSYATTLKKEYDIDERIIRRLINIERYKRTEEPPYDLDFDTQLNAAVTILREENMPKLISDTKTIHELQDEAKAKGKGTKEKK